MSSNRPYTSRRVALARLSLALALAALLSAACAPATRASSISGSQATASGEINLSAAGASDWARWGANTTSPYFDDKDTGSGQIGQGVAAGYTQENGGGTIGHDPSGPAASFNQCDGSDGLTFTNNSADIFMDPVAMKDNGFGITFPAGTAKRTVQIWVGGWNCQGALNASLSDGSATAYAATYGNASDGIYYLVYTLTYYANNNNGVTLDVTWENDSQSGNLKLMAATLTTAGNNFTINGAADAYTENGAYAAENFGADPGLYVFNASSGNSFQSWLRFDTSSLPTPGVDGDLFLYGRNSTAGYTGKTGVVGMLAATPGGSYWPEGTGTNGHGNASGITWNSPPTGSTTGLMSPITPATASAYNDWDVTPFIAPNLLSQPSGTPAQELTFNLQMTPAQPSTTGTDFYYSQNNPASTVYANYYVPLLNVLSGDSPLPWAVPASYFGLQFVDPLTYLPTGSLSPTGSFGAIRTWDTNEANVEVQWRDIQPTATTWNWSGLDALVAAAATAHAPVMLTLGSSTPQWANDTTTKNLAGHNGNGSGGMPATEALWKAYVTAVTARYNGGPQGLIQYYEVWNEPNYVYNAGPPVSDGFFDGYGTETTVSQYAADITLLIEDAATIIHAATTPGDVNCGDIVVAPSVQDTPEGLEFLNDVLSQLNTAGQINAVDIVSAHLYVEPNAPEQMISAAGQVHTIMNANGFINKPLWNTETGWHGTTFSDQQNADYLARAYLLNWSAGVSQFFWYQWDVNAYDAIEPLWLNPSTGTVQMKPCGLAYQQMYSWMVGATLVSRKRDTNGTWTLEFTRPGGYIGLAVWNPTNPTPPTYTVPSNWGLTYYQTDTSSTLNAIASWSGTPTTSPVLLETSAP